MFGLPYDLTDSMHTTIVQYTINLSAWTDVWQAKSGQKYVENCMRWSSCIYNRRVTVYDTREYIYEIIEINEL